MAVVLPADVLVVGADRDDELRYAELFGRHGAGCVRFAAGAEAAFELLDRGADDCNPHLVIVDVDAPPATLIEEVRRLRDDPRTRSLPIVAVAPGADEERALELESAGASVVVAKRLDAAAFVEAAGSVSLYWRAHRDDVEEVRS